MSGDINVDDDEEEVELPESGEWFGRVPLQDIPLPIMDPPFCWLTWDAPLPLVNIAFTSEEGGDCRGGLTLVQLTRSASSGPTMSLKSSKDSSVKGKDEG